MTVAIYSPMSIFILSVSAAISMRGAGKCSRMSCAIRGRAARDVYMMEKYFCFSRRRSIFHDICVVRHICSQIGISAFFATQTWYGSAISLPHKHGANMLFSALCPPSTKISLAFRGFHRMISRKIVCAAHQKRPSTSSSGMLSVSVAGLVGLFPHGRRIVN